MEVNVKRNVDIGQPWLYGLPMSSGSHAMQTATKALQSFVEWALIFSPIWIVVLVLTGVKP